jgi:integrase
MNEYIKLVGEKAEINDIIIIKETKDGKNYDKDYEKNKLITVHTARRSFATNMYLKDIPTISIMKITGHKTEKAFLEYIKVTSEQNAKKLQSHPFFTRKMVIGG